MKKVWKLTISDHECKNFVGIYSSEEKAKYWYDLLRQVTEMVKMKEVQLNAEPDLRYISIHTNKLDGSDPMFDK